MIREVIYLGRKQIVEYVCHIQPPPLIMPEYYAAITIHNPKLSPSTDYPSWVRPILRLDFDDARLDPDVYDKTAFRPKLISDIDAEKSVVFLDFIDKTDKKFTVFINCESGICISAAYARFIKAVKPEIAVRGLAISHTDFYNPLVMERLQKQWSIKIREEVEAAKHV